MMKQKNRFLLFAFLIVFSCLAAYAAADSGTESLRITVNNSNVVLPSNEELATEYVRRAFYGSRLQKTGRSPEIS